MSLVKFLLAQQHVRLARLYAAQKNAAAGAEQQKVAQDLFRQIVKQFPKSPEAEEAAGNLAQSITQ